MTTTTKTMTAAEAYECIEAMVRGAEIPEPSRDFRSMESFVCRGSASFNWEPFWRASTSLYVRFDMKTSESDIRCSWSTSHYTPKDAARCAALHTAVAALATSIEAAFAGVRVEWPR